MSPPLVSIVIPCLNEVRTIARVVKDARYNAAKGLGRRWEIVVADNGSTDGTLAVLKKLRTIRVVHVPIRGYGAALHWGLLKSRGRYVLYADADGSYPFSNLGRFVSTLASRPDLVLGSRLRGVISPGSMPWLHRYGGTPILTWLIRLIYRLPTTDCNSGMRLVKKSFYRCLNMRNSGMEWASELLLKTAVKKGKYLEVPIRFVKDKRTRRPHLATWSDGWRHLKTIILLQPNSLFFLGLGALIFAAVVYPYSFALVSFALLFSAVISLGYLALRFLEFAIEEQPNPISEILNSNLLVPWVIMITVAIGSAILLVPDDHLGTKILLVAFNTLLFMWVFLIETIKTHLINRLPDVK